MKDDRKEVWMRAVEATIAKHGVCPEDEWLIECPAKILAEFDKRFPVEESPGFSEQEIQRQVRCYGVPRSCQCKTCGGTMQIASNMFGPTGVVWPACYAKENAK